MKVFVKGLNSCTMRKQKLQQYRNFLVANGHIIVDGPDNCDTILLWTCAFRADVRDNSISEITRYQQEYGGKLIVAGCLPDIARGLLQENFSGRVINWRDDTNKMEEIFGREVGFARISPIYVEEKLCDDAQKYRQENLNKDATFHDQFIKLLVSEGCNFKCTYCSERLAFPPLRSFSETELVESCQRMVEQSGQLEVILLADSLGDYGRDIGSSLSRLMRKLKVIHRDLKFALNNLNPASFIQYYDDMVEFLCDGDIIHLNLPIQSASTRILELMNRAYTKENIEKIFGMLNDIGFKRFDTHLIIGFPGETEEDFEETVEFILCHKPSYVLINGYMESPSMDAASLPDKVDEATKRRHLHDAETRIKMAGIICNTDDGEEAIDRCRRLNLT